MSHSPLELQSILVEARLVMVRQHNALLAIAYRAAQCEGPDFAFIERIANVALHAPTDDQADGS